MQLICVRVVVFLQQVDVMGGLFTHEYLTAHKVVLGFEHNHLVFLDIRMPRNSCWFVRLLVCSSVLACVWRGTGGGVVTVALSQLRSVEVASRHDR